MGNLSISCCRSRSPNQLRSSLEDHNHLNQNNCRIDCIEGATGQYSSTSGGAGNNTRQSRSLFNGNLSSTCKQQSSSSSRRSSYEQNPCNILQHISEREPDDSETDPSSNPLNKPIFATRTRATNTHATPRTKQPQQLPTATADTTNSTNDTCSSVGGCLANTQASLTPLACSQTIDYGYNSATSTNLNATSCSGGGGDQSLLIIYDSINSSNQSANNPYSKQLLVAAENNHQNANGSVIKRTDSKNLSENNKLSLLSTTNTLNELDNTDYSEEEDQVDDEDELNDEAAADAEVRSSLGYTNTSSMFLSGISSFRGVDSSGNSLSNLDRRKSSSCSTIYIDGSTISKPNLEQTMRYVSLAIYYHIKNRKSDESIEIFDETIHPLSKLSPSNNSNNQKQEKNSITSIEQKFHINQMSTYPTRKAIYKFVKTLIKAAQLTAEYAITTLVYLERLMTYGEMDLTPKTWRRMFLGAILLSSKVWEDQAVWNVDYAQILDEISVDDINELERQFLELIQFNMNVPSPVYAKYYFDLRTLASTGRKTNLLTVKKARALEAMCRIPSTDLPSSPVHRKPEPERKRHSSLERLRENGRAAAILM